jgi:hypothetical protein
MDADVELEHEHVLRDLVECLKNHPAALISAGMPIKHFESRASHSISDKISISATQLRVGMKGSLAGCLYCGRADWLRSFRLPTVLMGEDSFVRAMTVTRGFTQSDDPELVVRAPTARVIFEAYTMPSEIMRNKTRRMLELTINSILYERFWQEVTADCPAGELMRRWEVQDPRWSERLVAEEFAARGKRPIPRRFVYSQFRQLRFHSWKKRLQLFPVSLMTLPVNALAARRASRSIRSGNVRKLWDKPQIAHAHQSQER